MITNARGKVLCVHTKTGKRNFMDPSFIKNEALMKAKGWDVVQEPEAPPAVKTVAEASVDKPKKAADVSKEKKPIKKPQTV